MLDTLLLRTSLHFTQLYFTPLHYTCQYFNSSQLNFTQLHFTTLHYRFIWLNPTEISYCSISPHITSLHFTSLDRHLSNLLWGPHSPIGSLALDKADYSPLSLLSSLQTGGVNFHFPILNYIWKANKSHEYVKPFSCT
jgi:hypothetical protein